MFLVDVTHVPRLDRASLPPSRCRAGLPALFTSRSRTPLRVLIMSLVDALGDVLQPDGTAQSTLVPMTLTDMERQERLIIGQMQVWLVLVSALRWRSCLVVFSAWSFPRAPTCGIVVGILSCLSIQGQQTNQQTLLRVSTPVRPLPAPISSACIFFGLACVFDALPHRT